MTIVDQFIDQNEQLLDQLNAENPSLGGAIAEALAVIDFYAKSNKVEFDDKRKEELLASPVAEIVEIKQEPQMEAVLKKIDEVVAESTPTMPVVESEEMKWVVEASGSNRKHQILVLADEAKKLGISQEILDGESGNALLVMDKPLTLKQGAVGWATDLVDSQKQMTQEQIDQLLQASAPTPPETHTPTAPIVHESKEFVEDDILVSAEDLEALKQLEDLEDLTDINLDDLDI
jgi:hypothetical protein